MSPYKVTEPLAPEIPIVISVPHCGIAFPSEIKSQYIQSMVSQPDDTDWFVDRLYEFAPSLGMTMISAVYSRWVIDLNRDPESKPLYTDGRIITGLCPVTDFLGNNLYHDGRQEVNTDDLKHRLENYYWPYHHRLKALIDEKKKKFGAVLLWDCHSIRKNVPTIFRGDFPDLILGSADEKSAGSDLIASALSSLSSGPYSLQHNYPFKGGYITRQYGKPADQYHALQLEMTKVNYMDDTELGYDTGRAQKMQALLIKTFQSLSKIISA